MASTQRTELQYILDGDGIHIISFEVHADIMNMAIGQWLPGISFDSGFKSAVSKYGKQKLDKFVFYCPGVTAVSVLEFPKHTVTNLTNPLHTYA